MTSQHPITPLPELVEKWHDAWIDAKVKHDGLVDFIAAEAAQWGADQELEACVNYIDNNMSGNKAREFRAIRRPKAPSLKKQALADLYAIYTSQPFPAGDSRFNCIRRALEALDD